MKLFILLFILGCGKQYEDINREVSTPPAILYPKLIYLDFDGGSFTNAAWNNGNTIELASAGLDEIRKQEIINRVSLYFSLFKVTITKDKQLFDSCLVTNRERVILTQTHEWWTDKGETGAAVVNSFGSETPCFVFTSLLYHDPVNISKQAAHEIGHTLGCRHQSEWDNQCKKINEYRKGTIMGYGLVSNEIDWGVGPSTLSCDSIQNDLHIITQTLQYK